MMARPGKLFERQELLRAIWGDSAYRDPRGDRRPHPAPAREARGAPRGAEPDPDRARRRLPLSGAVTGRRRDGFGGCARGCWLALVFTSVVTLAVAALALLPAAAAAG